MVFSDLEKKRYFRQFSVQGWKQEKLKSAKVLIVGLGGLGSASALYLTAAGIGKLRLCDADRVEQSDLNRQILFSEKSINKLKVKEAKNRLLLFNPSIEVEAIAELFDNQNAYRLTEDCNLVVDGLDNNESRFILNKQAIRMQIPYVYGAVQGWEGFVGLFHPPHTACLACILQKGVQRPDVINVPGVISGTIGLFQAAEVVKFIMGVKQNLMNRLLIYDSRDLMFDVVEIEKNPNCSQCGA